MRRSIQTAVVLPMLGVLISALVGAPASSAPSSTPGRSLPLARQSQQATNTFTGTATSPGSVRFTTTGSLVKGRGSHSATLLANGKVLVAGGFGPDNVRGYSDSAELYDPATGTFTTTGSLRQARGYPTAVPLPDGKVLIVGGFNGSTDVATAELYEPTTSTFFITGSPQQVRALFTATLLSSGKVLIVGGRVLVNNAGYVSSAFAELYDPVTGTFSATGSLQQARQLHTATLLPDGKVLIAGGYDGSEFVSSAELYDPATGTFSATGDLRQARYQHTATRLPSGKVLVAGGYSDGHLKSSSAELYDPTTGTFSATGSLQNARRYHKATLLPDGKVLILDGGAASMELYDPTTGTFSAIGSLQLDHYDYTTTLLPDGTMLLAGGYKHTNGPPPSTAAAGLLSLERHPNTFTGTLTLPSGWLTTQTAELMFSGTTSDAPLDAGALSNDGTTWGSWIAAGPGEHVTATWNVGGDGANKPVYLRLRDANGQAATVVKGTVDVDTTPSTSAMTALPSFSSSTLPLSWSGSDTASGIASYDVEVRQGSTGEWTPVLKDTTATSVSYTATRDSTYYFRLRATNVAGHVEPWPDTYDTSTVVDTEVPTGTLVVNGGALVTTTPTATLTLAAQDTQSAVTEMHFGNDGTIWGRWRPYAGTAAYTLERSDGVKTVYAQFRDAAGNVSAPVSATIRLDEAAGVQRLVSINTGAVWTNTTTVTLTVGAPGGAAQMQMSNDGGFGGAKWQPFDTHPTWTINSYGSYVLPRTVYVRLRGPDGTISDASSDDIIYDPVPPTGAITIVAPSSVNPASTSVQVKLSASDPDNLSGVAAMRVGPAERFDQAGWEPYATSKTVALDEEAASDGRVCAQFRDGAGNLSETMCTKPSVTANSVYLPLVIR